MALVLGPGGNLLLGPLGNLANSTDCCCCQDECAECPCCQCRDCGEDYVLPTLGCESGTGKYCLTATLSGLSFVTACRTYRNSSCVAAPGTFASYKVLAASMGDLVIPFQNIPAQSYVDIRDPDSPCDIMDTLEICAQWGTCTASQDTGLDATQYANSDCTGTSNTFNVLIASAILNYQVVGATRRFVLYVTVNIGAIPVPIFLGVGSFDARLCANYSSWPLVISNGISSTACVCGASNKGIHPIATGGTATLTLTCNTPDCGGAGLAGTGGESMSIEALRGDVEGAKAAVMQTKRKGCCL